MKKYRINWINRGTGHEGNGQPVFDSYEYARHVAMAMAMAANEYSNHTIYWVEEVDVPKENK